MATTSSLLYAAARRRCSLSASTLVRREVTDFHDLTLDGCAAFREIPKDPLPFSAFGRIPKAMYSTSEPFEAAGHRWRIRWYPKGDVGWRNGHMSLYLELDDDNPYQTTGPVGFKFSLLDQAGNPVPKHSRAAAAQVFGGVSRSRCKGFNYFMKWNDLETSGCLKDDRFIVRCDITGFRWVEETKSSGGTAAAPPRVVVPPSNLHEDLNVLLWNKKGTDVTIDVDGETFDAHGWLLRARSPVFKAELLGATGGGARHRLEIKGIRPEVFKAMLHFMYTDALPGTVELRTVPMAQGLLAAAHRYKLERLKLMCEETLCQRIDVDTVATSLVVAEEHGCHALKAACLEFMARPGNLKAVAETEWFEKVKASCLPLMMELVMKKLP